jgi:hypothetical protein
MRKRKKSVGFGGEFRLSEEFPTQTTGSSMCVWLGMLMVGGTRRPATPRLRVETLA